jgi:hypothetical protein
MRALSKIREDTIMILRTIFAVAVTVLFCTAATRASFAETRMFGTGSSPANARFADRLYISDGQQGIYVFDAAKPGRRPITVIADSSGPGALAVDNNQWLYVANTLNNTVGIYKRGQTKPFRTLAKSIDMPTGVAVGNDGMVYVVDNEGDLVTFPRGSTVPSSSTHYGIPFVGVEVDGANNVYAIEGENTSYGGVQLHPGSSQIVVLFSTQFNEAYATGICQDLMGNFVVPGRFQATNGKAFIYPTAGGEPLNIQPIRQVGIGQAAFNSSGRVLFVSEGGGIEEPVNVVRYEYRVNRFRNLGSFQVPLSWPVGVALSPRMPLFMPSSKVARARLSLSPKRDGLTKS